VIWEKEIVFHRIVFVAVMFAQFFVQVFMLPIIEYAATEIKPPGFESVMTWMAAIGTVMYL